MGVKPGFTSIFNGKDLTGWQGDPKYWKVEDGAIVGRSEEKLDRNLFVWTEKEYSDFVFCCETRLLGFNSGIQYRSVVDEEGRMAGHQADMGNNCWGSLYEERKRGVLVPYNKELVEKILKKDDWNEFQIIAVDDYYALILNGVMTAEIIDPEGWKKGIFGLQLHGGPPQELAFRNIGVKEL
ncbi:DUF1080 domain-containing protein [Candidatus Poribacteria bacterium]|nr:DUF1080 domain-containing protein [Candidatus Poribacteria bacterium]